MKWPLQTPAIARSEIPLYNLYYLHAPGAAQPDPTILWGTEVEMGELQAWLRERNRGSPVLISAAHVLLQATAHSLVRHPELNRRVVGRRVYAFRDVNLRMAFHSAHRRDVDILLLRRANELCLEQIATSVWEQLLASSQGRAASDRDRRRMKRLPALLFDWVLRLYRVLDRRLALPTVGRLDELRCGPVLVNDLSFRGAPPMRVYKPTRFPDESVTLNITLGPREEKAVVRQGRLASCVVAPLFVRADHRIVDAYQLGHFVASLRDLLQDPAQMETGIADPRQCMLQADPVQDEAGQDAQVRQIA